MSVNGLNTSISALRTNQFRLDVTANNVANVNTDGFKASTVTTADRAYINGIGTGTQVTGTYAPPRPGAMAVDTAGAAANPTAQAQPVTPTQGTAATQATQTRAAPPPPLPPGPPPANAGAQSNMVELSNTDLVTEMTNMMSSRNAYSANTVMGRTQQEVTQTLMDLRA